MPGLCDVVVPPLLEASPGHLVACHLYGEEKKASVEGQASPPSPGDSADAT